MNTLCANVTHFVVATVASLAMTHFARAADPQPYNERWRPQFHFTAVRDWLNDPNGLVFFDGEYHLCFQRYPGRLESDGRQMAWGHAISADLVHWHQIDDALTTDAAGAIWSGSAVVDWQNTSGFGTGDKPPLVAMYTTAKAPFSQSLAYSNDRGRTWTKYKENPVIPNVHGTNRDPKVIWYAPTRRWLVVIYLDRPREFALFASADLKDWTRLQTLTLDADECPDFFPLNLDGDPAKQKWVFTAANGNYCVGTFDGKEFTAETPSLPSDRGPNYYAAQTYSDIPAADGRRIQIGWMRDGRYPGMPFNQQLSFPSVFTLRTTPEGPRLFRWPVKEIETLYAMQRQWKDVPLKAGEDMFGGLSGELFDINVEAHLASAKSVTLNVRGLPITLQNDDHGNANLSAWDRHVALPAKDGLLKMRVLVDRTSVEIYAADGEVVLSGCFLPPDAQRAITLTATGGTATADAVAVHELHAAH